VNIDMTLYRPLYKVIVDTQAEGAKISRHIYGHFSEHLGHCIYGGFWTGENSPIPNVRGIRQDVAATLKQIRIPNLRWPGGCFADEYHWKDGIGPRQERPRMINTHWGGVIEDNSFGTHEFLDLCDQLGCEPYICGNVGSGTVQELSQWVEYVNFDGVSPMADLRKRNGRFDPWNVEFWGIGNENWGCGGAMSPEFYADNYRRYAVYTRNYGKSSLYRIACGPNSDDYNWTRVLMEKVFTAKGEFLMKGLSLHYYTVPGVWAKKGSATDFTEDDWFTTLKKAFFMDELVHKHGAIMDEYDPHGSVGLIVDEWGTWYDVESGTNPGFLYQQNTLRDALTAGIHLNIFNNYAERIKMANIAQTVNVLQALIFTDGARMLRTPTYHVFDMYQVHQDAVKLPVSLDCENYASGKEAIPGISASASKNEKGKIHLSLCNTDPVKAKAVSLEFRGMLPSEISGRIITSANMGDHNTFDKPDRIIIRDFTDVRMDDMPGVALVNMPPMSVVTLEVSE
jgi:alpha-N-arabinofuranosidase